MMKKFYFVLPLLCFLFGVQGSTLKAGADYIVINAKAPATQNVTIVEFFNLGCPVCCYVDSALEKWLQNKPSYVTFTRESIAWNVRWAHCTQLYSLLDSKGLATKAVPMLFNSIHGADCRTEDIGLTVQEFIQLLKVKPYNLTANEIEAAFSDTSYTKQLQTNSAALMQLYQFSGIPVFIVNNQYKVLLKSGDDAPATLVKTLDFLVKKIHYDSIRNN